MTTRALRTLVIGMLVVVLGGCGSAGGTSGGTTDGQSAGNWPAAGAIRPIDGLVWAEGSTVHLPDGSMIDTGKTLIDTSSQVEG